MNKRLINKYVPMTETAYYILLSLKEERHGYAIMQHVGGLTGGRLAIGAGTLYGTLSKMASDGLIRQVNEYDRRKTYRQSAAGRELLAFEISRLREMLESAEQTAENM